MKYVIGTVMICMALAFLCGMNSAGVVLAIITIIAHITNMWIES